MFRSAVPIIFIITSLWASHVGAAVVRPPPLQRSTTPFDGQYISTSADSTAVEWWYLQALASDVEGDNPPANVQILYYQGYPVSDGSTATQSGEPEYYITINGMFANGTVFNFNVPTSTGAITTSGEAVSGKWGDAGEFAVTEDLSSMTANVSAADYGIEASISFVARTQHHFGCNATDDAYFDSAVSSSQSLSTPESLLYKQLGWATTIPGGTADVTLTVNGTKLAFTGTAYHDANWLPAPLNEAVSSWYFLNAAVGPYDMSAVLVQPVNSSLKLNTGFLAKDGVVLQNQCSVVGARNTDISTATPTGSYIDSGLTLPTGFTLSYTLANGDVYSFDLTSQGANPNQAIYHRWIGTATGGPVGGGQETGTTVFEWLNPGMNTYNP
ncbi:uncharacterized protein C8Q71DRAFT_796352 [Rhodofomes roseus]|uniref:AttH domain-containing protein n=1 Tax=Rhodofomes roseus TaxID=34475 RepID=A0ABQ8KJ61_9APHY|nr:uncharacterized protein C8Q71DRAFT_796352 [Rhodofomes roseus]KAH9838003.1 hypothetical protein C8Q71DRAFT_796352 [Rhodofomes roseus]